MLCLVSCHASSALRPDDNRIHYVGRHIVNDSVARFDWQGSGFSLELNTDATELSKGSSTIKVEMDAGGQNFALYLEDQHVGDLITKKSDGRRIYTLNISTDYSRTSRTFSLLKSTEYEIVTMYGIDTEFRLGNPPAPVRRIDAYGDSDSAAYGVDGGRTLPCLMAAHGKENFAHGWLTGVAHALRAELRTQAVSGIGVCKNAVQLSPGGDAGSQSPYT